MAEIVRGAAGKPWVTRTGEPLIIPDGEFKPINAELYDRISDIAGQLDTKENLKAYQQALAVCGVIRDKSLAWQFRALVSEHEDPWVSAKGEVKGLLKLAEMIGGDGSKSGIGTAIHRLCHLRDIEAEIIYPVAQLEPWLDVYHEAVSSRFEVLDDEVFVVCDDLDDPGGVRDLRLAGSFDRLLRDRLTGEVLVGDIKSGKQDNLYAMKPTVQVAVYARSRRYDQETGQRTVIHPDLNVSKGVLIHLPFNGGGEPRCTCYPLDLDEGWRLAQMASDIVAARKMRTYERDAMAKVKR